MLPPKQKNKPTLQIVKVIYEIHNSMRLGDINHISINDYFWIRFVPQMVNFGFQGLPEKVHYSISFSDKSPDINFHVTKEAQDSTNKPKITIVRMDKKLLQEWLEEILPKLPFSFLNRI